MKIGTADYTVFMLAGRNVIRTTTPHFFNFCDNRKFCYLYPRQHKYKPLAVIVETRHRMKTIDKNISTFGLLTELTNSQTENFEIIKNHWKQFNSELKKYNLIQNGGNWEKYGITFKTNETYFYLTTIPKDNLTFPEHFIYKEIPKGEYEVFSHKGKMENIRLTINDIYRKILPNSSLTIEPNSKTGFIHFERYDYRFRWDKPNSEIDIYLPIKTKQNEEL